MKESGYQEFSRSLARLDCEISGMSGAGDTCDVFMVPASKHMCVQRTADTM